MSEIWHDLKEKLEAGAFHLIMNRLNKLENGRINELEERCEKYERFNLQNFEEITQLKNDYAGLISSFDKLRHDSCFTKAYMEKVDNLEKQMPDSFNKWENEFEQRLRNIECMNRVWFENPEVLKRIDELEKLEQQHVLAWGTTRDDLIKLVMSESLKNEEYSIKLDIRMTKLEKDFANICENRSIPDSWCKYLEERHKELRENLEYKLERIETSGKYNHSNLLDACRRIENLDNLKNKLVTAQLNVNNSLSNKLTELKDNNEKMCKKLITALGGKE